MSEEKQTKECPFCSEEINVNAKKCKHCGEMLDEAMRAAEEAARGVSSVAGMGSNSGIQPWTSGEKTFRIIMTVLIPLVGIIIGAINLKHECRAKNAKTLLILGIVLTVVGFALKGCTFALRAALENA